MKTKFWNGSFLRTVLQCLAIACAALLALSALGAGLVLGGAIDQKQISTVACCISFAAVFLGSFLAAKHAAGKRLPAALAVAGCCIAVCFLARLLFFENSDGRFPADCDLHVYACTASRRAGGDAKKELPAPQTMKGLLHVPKCKYYLLLMNFNTGLLSFQDFDPSPQA